MPLIFEKNINDAKKLAVWEITETLDFFVDKLPDLKLTGNNPKRKLEQVCSCFLMNYLSGNLLHLQLEKDEYGKPFILNSLFSVSFSHSKNKVACLFDQTGGPVGIDIEFLRDNIHILAEKFTAASDKSPLTGKEHFQLIWGAKEVLYKIHGLKNLEFKKDLMIHYETRLIGIIKTPEFQKQFPLDFKLFDNFMIVWNV